MMRFFSLAIAVHASTEFSSFPLLDADAEEVVGLLSGEFISPKDSMRLMSAGRILMAKEWFAPGNSFDPIETLMDQLGTMDRKVAVKYFISHNFAELRMVSAKVLKAIGIMKMTALNTMTNPPLHIVNQVVPHLFETVSSFVSNRVGRCMYDFVPMEFRDPVKYDGIFAELDRERISARKGDHESFSAYVKSTDDISAFQSYNDDTWYNAGVFASVDEETGIIKLVRNPHSAAPFTRLINPESGCACQVRLHLRNLAIMPKQRTLFFEDVAGRVAVLWKEGDVQPSHSFVVTEGFFADYVEYAEFFVAVITRDDAPVFRRIPETARIPYNWEGRYVYPTGSGEFAVCRSDVKDFFVVFYGKIFKMKLPDERAKYSPERLEIMDAIIYGLGDVPLTEDQVYLREIFRLFVELRLVEAFSMTSAWTGINLYNHVQTTLTGQL